MFQVRLTQAVHGLEIGDSILVHPALKEKFALVRLIPARYSHLLQLDNLGALEYLTGPLLPAEVERLLAVHFRTLQCRARGMKLLR